MDGRTGRNSLADVTDSLTIRSPSYAYTQKQISSFLHQRIFLKIDKKCDEILWEKISEPIYWKLYEEIEFGRK